MAYATIDQLRGPAGYLDQLTTDSADPNQSKDTLLQSCLNRAAAIIDRELGFTLTAAAVGTQVVYGDGGTVLEPPLFVAGSVTGVTAPSGYTVPSYTVVDGALVVVNSSGVAISLMTPGLPSGPYFASFNPFWDTTFDTVTAWGQGVPYTVSATFGASAADLLVAEQMNLELAVNLYKYRDAGGSTVVGTESAVVVVKTQFSPLVQRMIDRLQAASVGQRVGVW
jgi:hypothetical protein